MSTRGPLRHRARARLLTTLLLIAAIAGALGPRAAAQGQSADAVVLPRGDIGRSGAMPGSGPTESPDTAWELDADGNLMGMAASGDTLFLATKNRGEVRALDAATGEERWVVELGAETTVFGPALAGGLVVVSLWDAGGTAVVALDQGSGDEVWRVDRAALPTEPTVADGLLIVAAEGGFDATAEIFALDPETGDEIWARELPDARPGSAVAVHGGIAFVTDSGDSAGMLAIDVATGEERWTFTRSVDIVGDPLTGDGVVLIPDHPTFWAVDAETGEDLWTASGPRSGGGGAVVDGVAYLSYAEEVRAVDAESGEDIWSAPVVGIPGPPTVADGVLYVAAWRASDDPGSHWIYGLDAETGDELWSLETDLILSGNSPIVASGVLYVDAGRGLVALGEPGSSDGGGTERRGDEAEEDGDARPTEEPDEENGDPGDGDAGSNDAGRYESEEFGFVLEWSPPWTIDDIASRAEDGMDTVVLETGDTEFSAAGSTLDLAPEEMVSFLVGDRLDRFEAAELVDQTAEDDLAAATIRYEIDGEPVTEYVEVRPRERGVGLLMVRLVAPAASFADDIASAKAEIGLDDDPPFVADPAAPGGAAGDDGGEEAEDGAGTYESPQYGYTLAYDPDEWEISAEDADADDAYDTVQFFNGATYVSLTGDPDYDEDDLDRCLGDYLAGLEATDGVDDVEPLEDAGGDEVAGEEDGVAFAAHTYSIASDDGDPIDAVRYTSCQFVGDGVTLVVAQSTLAAGYEDQFEAREELLEGLEIPGEPD